MLFFFFFCFFVYLVVYLDVFTFFHASLLPLCVTIFSFLLHLGNILQTQTGLIVPWHAAFLDICDHAMWRRPDEYEQRRGGGVKEQRCGAAVPGWRSRQDRQQEKLEKGPPTGRRSYCTLAGRIHFSFPVLFPLPTFLSFLFLSRWRTRWSDLVKGWPLCHPKKRMTEWISFKAGGWDGGPCISARCEAKIVPSKQAHSSFLATSCLLCLTATLLFSPFSKKIVQRGINYVYSVTLD